MTPRPSAPDFTKLRETLGTLLESLAKSSSSKLAATQARASRVVEDAWEKLGDQADVLKEYLASDDFEKDLDELAEKLGIHYSEHPNQRDYLKSEERALRVRAKLGLLLMTSGRQIVGAKMALPLLSGQPKLARRLGSALALVKSAEILVQSWKVFRKKRRPKIIAVK